MKVIQRNLHKNFSIIFNWSVDHEVSIYFEEDKTKCIPFGNKHRLNKVGRFDI